MLLSDISQGLHDGLEFPPGLEDVEMTEVMRCSQRVKSAAEKFQMGDAGKVTCHHRSEGPPLSSYIFDAEEAEESRYEQYATQTVRAVQHVRDSFKTLNVHNRLAVIVPNSDFRAHFFPLFDRAVQEAFGDQLKLVTAAEAFLTCTTLLALPAPKTQQHIVVDEVQQTL